MYCKYTKVITITNKWLLIKKACILSSFPNRVFSFGFIAFNRRRVSPTPPPPAPKVGNEWERQNPADH